VRPKSRAPTRRFSLAHDIRLLFSAVGRPSLHQLPALLSHVATTIGGLHLVGQGVRQRHLRHVVRIRRHLAAPVLEGRAEAVRDDFPALLRVDPFGQARLVAIFVHAVDDRRHRGIAQWFAAIAAGEQVVGVAGQAIQNRESLARERDDIR
jgi:hypothetical protein